MYLPGCVTRNFQEQSTMARAWLGNCPRWTQPPGPGRHESGLGGLDWRPFQGGLYRPVVSPALNGNCRRLELFAFENGDAITWWTVQDHH
jgi:hypothetical protein